MTDVKRAFRGGRLFTPAQALLEASRCLQCENAPCTHGCPAGIDVRAFIEKLRTENFRGALRLLRERNILGEVCAWACPVEVLCEGRCSSTQINYPLKIAALQQFVCAQEWGATPALPPKAPPKGKKVAIIGAGPAGLACAFRLVALGYEADVLEAQPKAGGLLSNAIPPDRLPEDVVQREVELIERYGVRVSLNAPLSDKLTLDTLFQCGFSAVFLGIGLGEAISTLVPGSDLDGVVGSLGFLAKAREKGFRAPSSVAVIGGGNTAMDAACTAKAAGARDVYLLYRRSFHEMPAWPHERNLALDAGIHVMVLTAPVRYVGDAQGRVCAVVCTHMQLGESATADRRRPEPLPHSQFTLPVALVVEAVGQAISPEVSRFLPGVDFTREGHIKADKDTLMTSRPGVFAGGDFLSGGATVVQAVAEGLKAAEAIARWLDVPKREP